jgi:hypothetical protein
MDVTINIIDWLFWFVGSIAIWQILPKDLKEELGSLIGYTIMLVWTILCVVILGFCGYDISLGIN